MRANIKREALLRLHVLRLERRLAEAFDRQVAPGFVYAPYIPLIVPDPQAPSFPMDLVTTRENAEFARRAARRSWTEPSPERILKFFKVYSAPGYPIDPQKQAERNSTPFPSFLRF